MLMTVRRVPLGSIKIEIACGVRATYERAVGRETLTVGELELIRTFQRILGERGDRLELGPGDEAAVVRASERAVVATAPVVDGVPFELRTHSYADVGHKALATALSDLAAMGVGPGEAYVAIG